jgi:hypothetical protein
MSTIKAQALQVAPADLFTTSSTQGTDLGALASSGDGRYFRYCLAGATTLVPGKLQQSSAQDTTNYNPSGGLAVAAAAAGTFAVTLTGSLTITANALAGGYLSVNVTPGQGYLYRIKSNTGVTAAANCVVTLEDALQVALTTSSKVVMTPHQYNGVVVNPTTATGSPVGFAIFTITNAQYGWIQTHGPVSYLNDASTAVGLGLAPSAATAGACKTMAATLSQVGYALNTGVTTEYDIGFATID